MPHAHRLLLVLGIVVASGIGPAVAADRFVSVEGSDAANDCTNAAAPCRTIATGVAQAAPGDVVKVARGDYDFIVFEAQLSDLTAVLSGSWELDFSSRDAAARSSRVPGIHLESFDNSVLTSASTASPSSGRRPRGSSSSPATTASSTSRSRTALSRGTEMARSRPSPAARRS